MRLRVICPFKNGSVWQEIFSTEVIQRLKNGLEMKFVLLIISNQDVSSEATLLLVLGDLDNSHYSILDGSISKLLEENDGIALANFQSRGGGYIRIIDDCIIFYGHSEGCGNYDRELLSIVDDSCFLEYFQVGGINK